MCECWAVRPESRLTMLRVRKVLRGLLEGLRPRHFDGAASDSSGSERKPSASSSTEPLTAADSTQSRSKTWNIVWPEQVECEQYRWGCHAQTAIVRRALGPVWRRWRSFWTGTLSPFCLPPKFCRFLLWEPAKWVNIASGNRVLCDRRRCLAAMRLRRPGNLFFRSCEFVFVRLAVYGANLLDFHLFLDRHSLCLRRSRVWSGPALSKCSWTSHLFCGPRPSLVVQAGPAENVFFMFFT